MLRRQKCVHCGEPAGWQSKVDFAWRCDSPDCQPCWCLSCNGKTGAHDAEAVAAYQARARAAIFGDRGFRLQAVPDESLSE